MKGKGDVPPLMNIMVQGASDPKLNRTHKNVAVALIISCVPGDEPDTWQMETSLVRPSDERVGEDHAEALNRMMAAHQQFIETVMGLRDDPAMARAIASVMAERKVKEITGLPDGSIKVVDGSKGLQELMERMRRMSQGAVEDEDKPWEKDNPTDDEGESE